jgi:ubiquinone/menaquinone biosynthesis C-methylase UbiE
MSEVENALYADPRLVDLYDLLNSGDWDYAFYAKQIGKQHRKVLDLGCGTGNFALRLAAAGHEVVAVDPSPMMINYARHRLGANEVEWIVGDAVSAQNHAPFDVVTMTGHAFQCLSTDHDVEVTLRIVREVLGAGGRFMFETRNPVTRPWTAWTPVLSARSIQSDAHGPVDVFHKCIEVAEPLVEFETHYVFGRDNTRQVSKSRLRFTSSEELSTSVNLAGFRDCEWFGDWSGGPFQEASSAEIIAICHA